MTRRELLPLVDSPAKVRGNATDAGHVQIAVFDVQQCAVARAIGRLGEVEIPAKAEVQGQLLGDAPGVLRIEEGALLEFLGVGGRGDVAVEAGYVAEQEAGKSETAWGVLPGRGFEVGPVLKLSRPARSLSEGTRRLRP